MWNVLAVFIGGGLGSITRYGVSKLVTSGFHNINPVGTLVSNIVSTSLLGLVLFLATQRGQVPTAIQALIVIGFCGGFSTFSTFSYETFELIKTGSYFFAGMDILISTFLGISVLFLLSRYF